MKVAMKLFALVVVLGGLTVALTGCATDSAKGIAGKPTLSDKNRVVSPQ